MPRIKQQMIWCGLCVGLAWLLGACALVTVTAVLGLAYRCSRAVLGDGPVEFTPMAVMGLLLFALPLTVAAFSALDGLWLTTGLVGTICLVASAILVSRRPGNLVALWFPYLSIPGVVLILITGLAARRMTGPTNA